MNPLKAVILCVDDEPGNSKLLERTLVPSGYLVARQIALSHHERWDWGGYPFGLSGEQIPLAGRIMNIGDQYDALRNPRVYKPAFDHAKAVKITEGDGRTMPDHFDPQVLNAFTATASLFEAVYDKYAANSGLTDAGKQHYGSQRPVELKCSAVPV